MTLVLVIYGLFSLSKLPIDAVPDITNNQVQVITPSPALGAPEVERLITFPIEQACANIPGLIEVRSLSRFGLSLVTLVFTDATDVYWARQQVNERLTEAKKIIPAGVGEPSLAPVTTGLGEIYQYVIRPQKGFENMYSLSDLRTIQDWVVRRQLLGVKGVADVSSFGGKLKQYEIAVNADRLKALNLSLSDLFNAINNSNENTGGAYIERQNSVVFVRSEGLIGSFQDIENIVIKNTPQGLPICVKDVATVQFGYATRYGMMCYNDLGEVAGAVVMMLKGANSAEVITNVKERIAEIQKSLPKGLVIEPFLDRTKMVNSAVHTVEKNLTEGALIVLFVLILFLGTWRAGVLVASVIPLSMLFAVIMMNFFGVSGNLMSLGALDFGLLVDGAVIIVEAVMHHLMSRRYTHKLPSDQMDGEVVTTAKRIMSAAAFGELIILAVYLPIFTLNGIEGKMFIPMAQTVAFAITGAFILSLTYVPMMASLVLNTNKDWTKPNLSDRIMHRIENAYAKLLAKVLAHSKVIVGVIVSAFVGAIMLFTTLGGEFIPTLEEGDFAVEFWSAAGSNLETVQHNVTAAAKVLLQFPEVEKVVGKTGASEIPTDPMPIEATDLMVILKPQDEWVTAHTFDALADTMNNALNVIPGISHSFQFPVQMRFNELMSGGRQEVVCKVFGENADSLARYARQLEAIVKSVEGAADLFVEEIEGMPAIVVTHDRAAMARYGLSIKDVNQVLNTAFAGAIAGTVYEEEKRFDMVLRLQNTQRKTLDDVRNLMITTPTGALVPLSLVANIEEKSGASTIRRDDAQRRLLVGFNTHGRDVQSIVEEVQNKVKTQMHLASGYHITYGGDFENLNAAKARLSIAVPIALLMILLMLYFAFGSLKQGLLIFTAIPLSTIGGILALWLRGMPFSISAGVGFIALFGVAVLNGLVLISECNHLRQRGMTNLVRIVLTATRTRLRPILMTAAVASFGFLPMAISTTAGSEVQRPLATVVMGGLFSATILTLFVLPILYVWFERIKPRKVKLNHAATILLLGAFSFNLSAQGQPKVLSLSQALDLATKNNLTLKAEALKVQQKEVLIGTAKTLPKTDFGVEVGQINSRAIDSRMYVGQSFKLPSVYDAQRQVLQAEAALQGRSYAISEKELKRQTSQFYYDLVYYQQRHKLLKRLDSLYQRALDIATKRSKAGEGNALEYANAESRHLLMSNQLAQNDYYITHTQQQLKLLLNTNDDIVAIEEPLSAEFITAIDTSQLAQTPSVLYYDQQVKLAENQTQLAREQLKPDFSVGYSIMSIQGTQTFSGRDYTYNALPQFSTLQLGVQVPLFAKSLKKQVEAQQMAAQIAKSEYLAALNNQNKQVEAVLTMRNRALANYQYYISKALPQVRELVRITERSQAEGDADYVEYFLAIEQQILIENSTLDALHDINLMTAEYSALTAR